MNRALRFFGPWDLRLTEQSAEPPLEASEVLVRVRATGICGTDIGILRGDYGARQGVIIGHESAGDIVEIGSGVSSVRPGDRGVIDPAYYCGFCRMCRTDRPNHCTAKTTRESGVSSDGTFATLYRTEERFVHGIADHVSYAEASLTEPLSCVLTGLNQMRLRADLDTAVIGAGPMGMLYCHALAARGFTGTVLETSAARRRLCEDRLPAGWSMAPPDDADTSDLDFVVDTSGVALPRMLPRLRRGGQVLLVGLAGSPCTISPWQMADRSISVVGSIDSIGTFALASRMIESGTIRDKDLVTHELPLDDFGRAFSLLGIDFAGRRRSTDDVSAIKVVLAP